MRVSDVLRCHVVDDAGHDLGPVRDVRLVLDGPPRGSLAALRLDAVVVGGDGLAGRLGYLRGGVRGPWPLAPLLRRLERRAPTFRARDIADWDVAAGRLVLAPDARPEQDPDA